MVKKRTFRLVKHIKHYYEFKAMPVHSNLKIRDAMLCQNIIIQSSHIHTSAQLIIL